MIAERYIGEPWVAGSSDCWNFARRVWREEYGIDVPYVDVDAHKRLASTRAFADHAERSNWQSVGIPEDGDAVAMGKSNRVCHVGIWVDGGILHSVKGRGVIYSKLGALPGMGLRVLNYYRRVEHASDDS